MRVPLSWLRDYVDVDLEPEALAERLTLLGMEVQAIERRGDDWRRVVVGELLEVTAHPASDHLNLVRVRTSPDEPVLRIVCGAQNIAPGQRVPVALPGAVLPGERRIEVTRIAGEQSQGMLCSGDELGLTTDADGILILPAESPLGESLADLLGDVVFDVDVKPNRGDALSLVGLAREVAAATGARLRWPAIEVPEWGDATRDHLEVEVIDEILCPRFVGRYVDGLGIGPSPLRVQARLTAAGMRPVSNVVDASNYAMLELGKPTHTFDAAAVADGHILVRLARAGERLETLDHVERELTEDTLIIADPRGPIGIAGVMGGAASEVGDSTRAVIIESAVFDPVSIRRTARRYALRSEASLRFEKGQESRLARLGADRVAQLVALWAGARPAIGRMDTAPVEPEPTRVPFRPARVARLLGVGPEIAEMQAVLARVEVATQPARPGDEVPIAEGEPPITLDVATAADALVAIVPPHRRDLRIEADIAEEIARIIGYDRIGGRLPETPMPSYRPDPRRLVDDVRDHLAGAGLAEIVTHALVAPADHERIGIPPDDPATVRVTNPVSAEHSQLRRSLVPGLLRVLVDNERQRRGDIAVFEIGHVHRVIDGEPVERAMLGILLAGDQGPAAWNRPARPADLWEVRGLVDTLCARLGVTAPASQRPAACEPYEHPGRTAVLRLARSDAAAGAGANPMAGPAGATTGAADSGVAGQAVLGRVFEVHPAYLDAAEARAAHVAVALVDLDALVAAAPPRRIAVPVPRVPAAERDLAVVVDEGVPAGEVEAVVRDATVGLLRGLRLFDVYHGAPLGDGERSLAFRLTLQAADRTLEDEEIDGVIAAVVSELESRLGAHIRR